MQGLVNKFNTILNENTIEKSTCVADIKRTAYFLLKEHTQLNLDSCRTDYSEFRIQLDGKTHSDMIGTIDYYVYVTFKISSKRSDELVEISKLRKKYLNYLPENPVSIKSIEALFYVYDYKMNNNNKISRKGTYISDRYNVNKNISLAELDNEIEKIANSEEFNYSIKLEIVQVLLNKAGLNREYAEEININQFITDNKTIDIERVYQYIVDNKLLG